jgi:hypothetical protein
VQCPNCGEYNRAVARFCHECGSALAAIYQPPPSTADTTTRAASSPSAAGLGSQERPRDENGRQSASYPETSRSTERARQDERGAKPGSRRVAVPFAVVALAGILALAGWQLRWPTSVFGARQAASSLHVSHRPSGHTGLPQPATSPPPPSPTSSAPSQGVTSATPASSVTPAAAGGAVAVLQDYVAAINRKDYGRAWQLDSSNAHSTYAVFVAGFDGTVKDTLKILNVSGNVVTARLTAVHSNGKVQVFQGTYTIRHGIIATSNVHLIG